MHEDIVALIKEYKNLNDFYLKYYGLLSAVRDAAKDKKYTLPESVDLLYVIRETSKLLNDLRKESDGVENVMINITCLLYLTKSDDKPIRGKLATGSPNVSMIAKIPNMKRDPEEFAALMEYFGIPRGPIEEGILKPYWPGLCEHISRCAEEGKPTPPGVSKDSQYPLYKMSIRHKRDLLEIFDDIEKGGDIKEK